MLNEKNTWQDYALLDAGNGEKIERWKDVILRRPDPQAIWPINTHAKTYKNVDAIYHRSSKGGGHWEYIHQIPEAWTIHYRNLTFRISPTGFKHTGLFPEQAKNWDWMMDLISKHKDEDLRILNLFAYTGGATLAASSAGAQEVVHVDAAKGMVEWAKTNRDLSHLQDHKIRFIVDDCLKFVEREKRRGRTYHGIIMDPPSYGRGPSGEMWKFEKEIVKLIDACLEIFDEDGLFFLINSYTTGISAVALEMLMKSTIQERLGKGTVESLELTIPMEERDLVLPCGVSGRWQR
ncbi:MAG: class I SAM-dependent methyltransferase [Solobacterium sp.]|nr:class I SAM-dependent methyltransferase [Solobacterium sp.]